MLLSKILAVLAPRTCLVTVDFDAAELEETVDAVKAEHFVFMQIYFTGLLFILTVNSMYTATGYRRSRCNKTPSNRFCNLPKAEDSN